MHSTSICHKSACEFYLPCCGKCVKWPYANIFSSGRREQVLSADILVFVIHEHGCVPDTLAWFCTSLSPRPSSGVWHCLALSRPFDLRKLDSGRMLLTLVNTSTNRTQHSRMLPICNVAIFWIRDLPSRRPKCPFWSVEWNVRLHRSWVKSTR